MLTGQPFATGDVLLEIETDKAQMDVEAPEDGVMAKIIVCNSEISHPRCRLTRASNRTVRKGSVLARE